MVTVHIPDTLSDAEQHARFEALRADRVAQVRYRSTQALVSEGLVLDSGRRDLRCALAMVAANWAEWRGRNLMQLTCMEASMKQIVVCAIGCALLLSSGVDGSLARAQQPAGRDIGAPPPTPDQLLAVSSVVGGRSDPIWSPTSSEITYLGSYGGPLALWSVEAGGGQPRLLVRNMAESGTGYGQRPLWLPKGGTTSRTSRPKAVTRRRSGCGVRTTAVTCS